jgi:RHS repeat-associated protein
MTINKTLARAAAAIFLTVWMGQAAAQGASQQAPGHKVRQLVGALSQAGDDPQRPAKVQELKAQLTALKAQENAARSDLVSQRGKARSLAPSIAARQDQHEAEFEKRAAAFDKAAKGWLNNPSDATLAELDQVLKQYPGAAASPPALPRTLPWGSPKTNKRMPAETASAWYRSLARDERVQLAQAGPLTTVGGVRFTVVPEPGQGPQDADLAETAEVQLTPEIRAKAQELDHSPVNILNWVRANVQFVPTWGATRGAQATLQQLRGNAADTTSLTIALLRASGIPARYQFGTVDVPVAVAGSWVGGVSRPEAIIDMLQQGGIAARGIAAGGEITAIRMEHVWALGYVNWTPGRGSRAGGFMLTPPQHPNPIAELNTWAPLDGSFKQYQLAAGASAGDIAPFNAASAIDSAKQGAACTAASARQVNQSALAAHYAQFRAQAQQQLGASDVLVSQVTGRSVMTTQSERLLAGTLPFPIVAQNAAVPELTSAIRWRLQLGLLHGAQQVLALDKTLPELEGQLLTLSFVPETADDAAALAALMRPESGGDATTGLPSRVAAYLVKVSAQWRLNGQVVAQGGSFTLGQPLTLRSLLQNPQGNAAAADTVVAAGETHVWAVQGHSLAPLAPAAVSQRLAALRDQLQSASLPAADAQAAELLFGAATAYQASLDAKSRLYQRVAGAVEARLPSVARASTRVESEELFGLITHARSAGVGLHIDRLAAAVAARGDASAAGYSRQSLERASAEAHHVLNRLFGAGASGAQSTLSGLAAAAQTQTLWRADAATAARVIAALDGASTVRSQVEYAAANGMQALVAQSGADLGGLPMDPLVVLDTATGSAAYSVTSRNLAVTQLTAQRPGLAGWLGLADAAASKQIVTAPLEAAIGQLNTAQALLGDIDSTRWQAFAGRDDVLDGIYTSRISQAASVTNACDWLISLLASQLGTGLPDMSAVNRAPAITSTPVATAQADLAYSYAVQASDADGDALAYTLGGAPSGMTISGAGLIQWARPVAGQFAITVQVSDGKAVAEQRYNLVVSAASAGLNVGLALNPSIASPGQTVTLSVVATSGAGSVTRSATLAGAPLTLSAQGDTVFAAPVAGAHAIVVTATDGKSTMTREVILTILNPADSTPPTATITSPEADAGLRGVVVISGSATDANFAYYQLQMRRAGDSDTSWREIGRGLSPVVNGTLGQLDTSVLANGQWNLRLRVLDVNGAETTAGVTIETLGNLKLGQFRLSFADVRAEAPGFPLMLTRTYDSTKKDAMGDFGWGWSAAAQDLTVRKNMLFGQSWTAERQNLQQCLKPLGKRRISITLPDGGLYRFDAKNEPECESFAVPQVNIVFTPVAAPTGGASGRSGAAARLEVVVDTGVLAQGGMLVDSNTGEPWNPKDFQLTTEEGFKYYLREGVGVMQVTDPYGNYVSYGANGYQHNNTLSVSFLRDGAGRITKATDPNGKSLSYAYNAQGELESVTDRDGKVTKFSYATVAGSNGAASSGNSDQQHLLASITDPAGNIVMGNQFDTLGRLVGTADALGQAATQSFDMVSKTQTVTDRRGNKSVYTFDDDGNITQSVNALGQTTTFTFDANGNETSVTNALGHKTERTFDLGSGKQLSEKNPLGHTTSTTYSPGAAWQRVNPITSVDARGNATTYEYLEGQTQSPGAVPFHIHESAGNGTRTTQIELSNANGNLHELNIAGEVTRYGYDAQGRRTSETNGLGHVITYGYDAVGNETSRTVTKSVNGQTVTFTTTRKYDAENRVVEETDPLGAKRSMTYNAAGKVASETDSLGRLTRYTYDANARLTRTDYPDGMFDQVVYDADGNETSRTDRSGHITRHSYDALGRLAATQHPDGSSESTEFDAAGRVKNRTDRRGKTTAYEYDDAGRQTASVDATGRRTSQTYDENGNRKSVTVDGRTTHYEYDALNRLTKTRWPDGSTHTTVYRLDNRKESETDVRGVITSYGYDAAGRLTSVAQSLSSSATATTAYGYDETGAKIQQRDALGRLTTWTIDGSGRITARQIQDGSRETSSYDLAGNRLARTSFAGERFSYTYDAGNRLQTQIVPPSAGGVAGTSAVLAYSAGGRLLSVQEQGATTLGGTQSFKYDASDRVTEVSNPLGAIRYGLDAAGAVTERSVAGVGTVKSEHDDEGRLTRVTAADGKVASYFYDLAGRVARVEREINPKDGQAQTLVTYYRYDSADRLIVVVEVKRVGTAETLIAGQAITRAAGGTITQIDTYRSGAYDGASGQFIGAPARIQAFEYDGNARLTREVSTKDGASIDTRYEYDAAGNRSKKTVTSPAGSEITSYAYDAADRLTQESVSLAAGGSRVTTYGWDGNGNLASRTEPGRATLYRFDPQNRLIDIRSGATQAEAQAAVASLSYSYDFQGNRVKKSTPQGTIGYLIDSSHAYAQVARETKGVDSVDYVHGLQLIRQTSSAGQQLLPLHGHLGTSLGAADADGNVVEQVEADAFGNLDQATGLKQTHLYTGEYWDQDAQLLYLRARWYDPKVGRFISTDPFEGRQKDPRSLNRYSYVHGDPMHFADPSGMTETAASLSVAQGSILGMGAAGATGAGMFLRNMVAACAATAVASTAFPGTSLPGPADLCTSNAMRVHFQVSTSPFPGKGTIHTTAPGEGVVQGIPVWGVTMDMVNKKMLELNQDLPGWWHLDSVATKTLIITVSQKLKNWVLAGGVTLPAKSVATAQAAHVKLFYRIDVDNLRGHNLRR